jgi:hypothetical protein
MKIKDILAIIEQNEWYKNQIKKYRAFPDRKNLADVLEHNYKKWLEMKISECEVNNE